MSRSIRTHFSLFLFTLIIFFNLAYWFGPVIKMKYRLRSLIVLSSLLYFLFCFFLNIFFFLCWYWFGDCSSVFRMPILLFRSDLQIVVLEVLCVCECVILWLVLTIMSSRNSLCLRLGQHNFFCFFASARLTQPKWAKSLFNRTSRLWDCVFVLDAIIWHTFLTYHHTQLARFFFFFLRW